MSTLKIIYFFTLFHEWCNPESHHSRSQWKITKEFLFLWLLPFKQWVFMNEKNFIWLNKKLHGRSKFSHYFSHYFHLHKLLITVILYITVRASELLEIFWYLSFARLKLSFLLCKNTQQKLLIEEPIFVCRKKQQGAYIP